MSLRAVGRALTRIRRVDAVLLRTSGPDYRFAPGLSDLDLTVIHSADGDAETLEFLDEFWTTYRRLKRWVPMLGEVELLTAGEFELIARLAPRLAKVQKTYVPVSIKRTAAHKEALDAAMHDEPVEAAVPHVLAFVFTKFTTAIMPRTLAYRADPTLLHEQRLARQLSTATATLSEAVSRLRVDPFVPAPSADSLMRRAARFYGDVGRCSATLVNNTFTAGDPTIARTRVDVPEALERFAAQVFGDLDVSILWSRPVYFPDTLSMAVVTHDDLDPSTFTTIADQILRFRREIPDQFTRMLSGNHALRHFRVDGFPFMVPRSTFQWFGELSPFYFPSFALSRPSLGGVPLAMFAPSRATCLREVLLHYRGFLSLKNNWQFSPTTEARLALYRATVDYIDGYTSVARGTGLAPRRERPQPTSLLEAYRDLRRSLKELGDALDV